MIDNVNENNKPNVVLASFPRSGNTFLRNILYHVYGVYSWDNIDAYNKSKSKSCRIIKSGGKIEGPKNDKLKELEWKCTFPIIKTHELPSKILKKCDSNVKIIYLIRDGRDSLVSMAHHRKDIVEPGTNFHKNLNDAIKAPFNTYFGGWGKNVEEWTGIADIILRFEDLIRNPIAETMKLKSILNLNTPDLSITPDFKFQQNGHSYFGGNRRPKFKDSQKEQFNKFFFRKGVVGNWKTEMDKRQLDRFWKKYGNIMLLNGYLQESLDD